MTLCILHRIPAPVEWSPLGADDFIREIERRLGRSLRPRKPSSKPRAVAPSRQLEMAIGEIGKVSP